MINKNLLIVVYSHPEFYPPTLNAIQCLSSEYNQITILCRNVLKSSWEYPPNVSIISTGKYVSIRESEKKNIFIKGYIFFLFTFELLKLSFTKKPCIYLLYDIIPLFSYRLIKCFIPFKHKLWYHNHDVSEFSQLNKYSISYFALKCEKWIFPKLDIFTLPSLERKGCFPLDDFSGFFGYIPNFPSKGIYARYKCNNAKNEKVINLLFQGSIGPMHGIEETIAILDTKINDKKLNLVLKGFISDEYKKEIMVLARKYGVADKLYILPPSCYSDVIKNMFNCHIGIGIHKKTDLMNLTLGTASNKIYEYAACGLPVILYDNVHFRKVLGKFNWAFFSSESPQSILECIKKIEFKYDYYSREAKRDFEFNLNYENYFSQVKNRLVNES